jgi:YD repeat-containing protein
MEYSHLKMENEDIVGIVGMTVDNAKVLLASRGKVLRVTMEDGEAYMVTWDLQLNRVNVEVKDGKVVRISGNF